ncbi:hypothetical protein BDV96DRAFT_644192 [Lophiotrema nucula]|uniref:Uncharacterized protein n=1 Tax=Lophiotrema nucula TaxID=690887 RepID=A0A6A5ZF72_9PLEO|nr:hypothetical protein BDV96DRAFT_644192 [Lophiotrema nucula]
MTLRRNVALSPTLPEAVITSPILPEVSSRRQYLNTAEVYEYRLGTPSTLPEHYDPPQSDPIPWNQSYADREALIHSAISLQLPWWKRPLVILCVFTAILVVATLSAVGGILAQNSSKRKSASEQQQAQLSTVSTTAPTFTSTTVSSIATASAKPTPSTPVYIGRATLSGISYEYAWLDTASSSSSSPACSGTSIVATGSGIPCDYPFRLSDGVEYRWTGCGGDTWVTWDNGSSQGRLGNCVYRQRSEQCSGVGRGLRGNVTGNWYCG